MYKTQLAFIVLSAVLTACDGLDRGGDCRDICRRFRECFAAYYDVDRCEERCRDMDSRRESRRIDYCEECLDDVSCSGAFRCTPECAGIVP